MKLKYPLYIPFLKGNEQKYVNECLTSTWISSKGSFISKFEKTFAQHIGVKFAVTVCNGTVAMHDALIALGIKPGDEVIVPTFTYIASVNPIRFLGATPVFVDSLASTWQIDPEDIKRKISPRTKAIIVVHLYGFSCDMDAISKIAKDHGLKIIEDCAEAFGTKYKNKIVGSLGDISIFSFFGNKTITTGEGGMITTNNLMLYEKAVHYKGQALVKDREYWHDDVGYNYRMTNICAAIGLAQLEKAKEILEKKRQIANWYKQNLSELNVSLPPESPNIYHTYWLFTIMVENQKIRVDLRKHLEKQAIETRPAFNPAHTMPMYASGSKFPVAENLSMRGINLPSYPALSRKDVQIISNCIRDYYEKRT